MPKPEIRINAQVRMRLHPLRGWYQEAPPRGAWVRQHLGAQRCANPMRPQMSAVGAISTGLPTSSEWAMPRLARQRGLEQPSDSRADVVLAATAEPQRVHGQRPWFKNSMTKECQNPNGPPRRVNCEC